jgi:hypothetical protein
VADYGKQMLLAMVIFEPRDCLFFFQKPCDHSQANLEDRQIAMV